MKLSEVRRHENETAVEWEERLAPAGLGHIARNPGLIADLDGPEYDDFEVQTGEGFRVEVAGDVPVETVSELTFTGGGASAACEMLRRKP